MKYYFTYGTHGQPFSGGWTVVRAQNYEEAIDKFSQVHPLTNDGFIDCAFVYDEEAFNETQMPKKGNFGKFQQEEL